MILRAKLAVAYATSRSSHAKQVKGDDPDKKGYPGPPGWGLGIGPTTLPHKTRHVKERETEQNWKNKVRWRSFKALSST
jgi:hypothetical protein